MGAVVGRGESLLHRCGLLAFSQVLASWRWLHQCCWLATRPALKLSFIFDVCESAYRAAGLEVGQGTEFGEMAG